MIRSFRDAETEAIFLQQRSRRFGNIERTALRKLIHLHRAKSLQDLRLPGNHLEALIGDRKGQYRICVNDQYRVCFQWEDEDAYDVEISDYH